MLTASNVAMSPPLARLKPTRSVRDCAHLQRVSNIWVDPESVLRKLIALLKPGGLIYASSPNASHWKIVSGLVRGRFDYEDFGRWTAPTCAGSRRRT